MMKGVRGWRRVGSTATHEKESLGVWAVVKGGQGSVGRQHCKPSHPTRLLLAIRFFIPKHHSPHTYVFPYLQA